MDEEIQLIKECLRGKRRAQKELYDRFSEQMLGVCYRYTKCRADAEEVLQIGFIKVFKYLEQFRSDGDLGAWIRRIMVNSAINYLKRKPQYQLDLSFDENPLHPVDTREPDAQLNLKDLLRLILQLPVGYQTIFNLHAIEGYTHVEIAKLLGIHEGTSRSQYARARALLINWLDQSSVNHKKNTYVR
ncbi:MAG: sigma-70 family RNA polymerase sigma factor [Sphingobacteriia bacterium]|jgi:RNA polymerase sigma factor (sigma-70 family)|nr:MAG: sigma-70 family RNA polymerase sigma factor [Sphingobacteriia bacterium]